MIWIASKQSATAASKDGGGGGGVGGSGGAGGAPPTPKDDSSKIKVQSSDKTISISKPSNGHNGDKNNNHRRSKANKTIEKYTHGLFINFKFIINKDRFHQ